MGDLCYICEKSLLDDSVNVVRGLKTLKTASIERNDGHIGFLNTLTSVNVHSECRKKYISKNSIAASKRRERLGVSRPRPESLPSPSTPRKTKNEVFDFKKLCLFCGQTADGAAELKKNVKYRRRISNVSTPKFRANVIQRANERKDAFAESVKDRILYEYDLIAAEAKYHGICYTKFLNRLPKRSREVYEVTKAMKEIYSYIENHENSQFTLKELQNILTEYVPYRKTIIARLQQKYLTDIVIMKKVGTLTIISLRDTHTSILSKNWYENNKKRLKRKIKECRSPCSYS